ncbi:MAG: phosphodiester glycosidase family protein [Chthonomonadales bacterium]
MFTLLCAAALLAPPPLHSPFTGITSDAKVYDADVAPGIHLTQQIIPPPRGPLVINALTVNPRAPGVRMETAFGQDVLLADDPTQGRETVGSMATRHGAMAAINADFFPYTGDPVGLAIRNGELVRDSLPNRAVWGITAEGRCVFGIVQCRGAVRAADGAEFRISGVNRPLGDQEMVILTPTFGARCRVPSTAVMIPLSALSTPLAPGREVRGIAGACTAGDPSASIPAGGAVLAASGAAAEWLRTHLHIGDSVTVTFDLEYSSAGNLERSIVPERPNSSAARARQSVWNDVVQAVGGGPWLVRNGRIDVDGTDEGFNPKTFVDARHPRSAIGLKSDGQILLVTVDGRQPQSRGVTLTELAEIMMRLGAVDAINLDGGGSTSMWLAGGYVNAPSDGLPNAVAEAILVYANPGAKSPVPPTKVQEASQPEPSTQPLVRLQAGESVPLAARDAALKGNVIWSTLEGTAFVDQGGVLTGKHAGTGTAVAWCNGAVVARIPFAISAGPPASLRASLGPAPNNPPDRSILHISVMDRYGNGAAAVPVAIAIHSGAADPPQVVTGPDGRAEVEVVWDGAQGAIQVTAGKLTAHLHR